MLGAGTPGFHPLSRGSAPILNYKKSAYDKGKMLKKLYYTCSITATPKCEEKTVNLNSNLLHESMLLYH